MHFRSKPLFCVALFLAVPIAMTTPPAAVAQEAKDATELEPLTVEAKANKKKSTKAVHTPAKPQTTTAPATATQPPQPAQANTSSATTPDAQGDFGYDATRTSTATKTDTPLRDIPQSVSVLTDTQIKDQNIKSIGEATRYVPGVTVAQGEGNRDEVVIRGQKSNADFFVDGVRDDAQVFRDLYNADRIEFLKGPSALIFGRGGGGGVINRVTKEAQFLSFNEGTVSFGSFGYKRATADVNAPLNDTVSFRLNAMYENSDSFRDFFNLERWGVNPTITIRPSSQTKVVVGYEHLEDHRTSDRGVPSLLQPGQNTIPAPTDRSTFFGNPDISFNESQIDETYATVEHTTDFGLKFRNHTLYANYQKFYQNVYPGTAANLSGGPLAIASPSLVLNDGETGLSAYNNQNDRENIFNQTDFTYKLDFGVTRHTLVAGAEFGHQNSRNFRHNGFFGGLTAAGTYAGVGDCTRVVVSGVTSTCIVPFSDPTISTPVTFLAVPSQRNNRTEVDIQSVYIQDQFEITRYLELIGGVRQDRFAIDVEDFNKAVTSPDRNFSRDDELTSPRAGIVVKPTNMLSIYGSYSVSYLPASGDQFNALDNSTASLEPEKFTNYEFGLKWDLAPSLSFTAAHYWLTRENSRFPDPNNAGFFLQTGASEVEGTELAITGYVTDAWQIAGGYAHQEGEITSATTVAEGTRLPLLPSDTFSLWNRYQFTPMWGAGIGVVYRADMIAALANDGSQVILPDYTTVDAAVYCHLTGNIDAQLNVQNVFNEKYFLTADNNNNLSPGAPTAAYVSLTAHY